MMNASQRTVSVVTTCAGHSVVPRGNRATEPQPPPQQSAPGAHLRPPHDDGAAAAFTGRCPDQLSWWVGTIMTGLSPSLSTAWETEPMSRPRNPP